ncbi:MAG: nucleotidyltransferase domain-containing protein [Clostridiales bacterium]|jgi:predicted nucleotidyltransferase|nr:nucleotidyltransferase domain-containing protein [Clostridiales bacterium]
MTKNRPTIEEIQAAVAPIAEKYGVERVYLFGSYARGDAAPGSDIDLRVEKGGLRTLWQLSGFRLDLVDSLDAEVDVLTTESFDDKILARIKGDEVVIYG